MTKRFGNAARAAALVTLGLAGSAGTAVADTLGDALVKAYTASGLIEQNRALLRAADEDVVGAMAALGPVVSWSASANQNFGDSNSLVDTTATIGLAATLSLFDGGSNRLALEAAKETVLATREDLVNIEMQVLADAVSAFMNLREDMETVALRQNNVRVIEQELRAARDRFDVGEITRSDVAQAEARLAESRANLAVAQGNLAIRRAEYESAIGPVPRVLTPPSGLPKLPAQADAVALAMRTAPALKAAQRRVTVSELNVNRARAAMAPSVSLEGRYGLTEGLDGDLSTNSGSITISAGQRLYDGGALSSGMRQAEANRDAQRAGLHLTQLQVKQNVRSAYANLAAARAQIEASQRRIRAARVAFRGVREEATLGARTTLDVLNAEQDLLDAQAAAISASASQHRAAYSVLQSVGLLTAEKLGLGVPTYDPSAYYNMVSGGGAGASSKQGNALDRILGAFGRN